MTPLIPLCGTYWSSGGAYWSSGGAYRSSGGAYLRLGVTFPSSLGIGDLRHAGSSEDASAAPFRSMPSPDYGNLPAVSF